MVKLTPKTRQAIWQHQLMRTLGMSACAPSIPTICVYQYQKSGVNFF